MGGVACVKLRHGGSFSQLSSVIEFVKFELLRVHCGGSLGQLEVSSLMKTQYSWDSRTEFVWVGRENSSKSVGGVWELGCRLLFVLLLQLDLDHHSNLRIMHNTAYY